MQLNALSHCLLLSQSDAPTELVHSLSTHLATYLPARPLTHSLPLLPYHRQVAVQHAADMSTQLHYHSVYRRLSLAARQLQWSVTLLYCHTLCRGLAVSLTLLCRLSISHLTTSRSAKGQVGPSTYKRGGDICNPRSQPHSCSNTMHAVRPAACHAHDSVSVAPHQSIERLHPSARRIKRSVASTKPRLNSHQRGQT